MLPAYAILKFVPSALLVTWITFLSGKSLNWIVSGIKPSLVSNSENTGLSKKKFLIPLNFLILSEYLGLQLDYPKKYSDVCGKA